MKHFLTLFTLCLIIAGCKPPNDPKAWSLEKYADSISVATGLPVVIRTDDYDTCMKAQLNKFLKDMIKLTDEQKANFISRLKQKVNTIVLLPPSSRSGKVYEISLDLSGGEGLRSYELINSIPNYVFQEGRTPELSKVTLGGDGQLSLTTEFQLYVKETVVVYASSRDRLRDLAAAKPKDADEAIKIMKTMSGFQSNSELSWHKSENICNSQLSIHDVLRDL